VVGKSIESSRNSHHAGCPDDDESNKEKDAGDFLHNSSTYELTHVCNAVAPWMPDFKAALNKCTPRVEELPSEDVDSTWKGSKCVHCGRDGQDSGRENN
jgi:hypothetical protein